MQNIDFSPDIIERIKTRETEKIFEDFYWLLIVPKTDRSYRFWLGETYLSINKNNKNSYLDITKGNMDNFPLIFINKQETRNKEYIKYVYSANIVKPDELPSFKNWVGTEVKPNKHKNIDMNNDIINSIIKFNTSVISSTNIKSQDYFYYFNIRRLAYLGSLIKGTGLKVIIDYINKYNNVIRKHPDIIFDLGHLCKYQPNFSNEIFKLLKNIDNPEFYAIFVDKSDGEKYQEASKLILNNKNINSAKKAAKYWISNIDHTREMNDFINNKK